MVNAPTLYPDVREVAAPPGRGRFGYYRKTNGWIVTAPTTPTNRSDYEYKGFTFLPQYGEFRYDAASGTSFKEHDARGVGWDPVHEPWRLIFQKGGAHEFPIDQIIAYRWHVRPPYREVKFPQLAGVEVIDLECPECDKVFSALAEPEVVQQIRTHLTTRVDARHSYTVADLNELGEEWGLNFETARSRRQKQTAPRETPSLEDESGVPEMAEPGEEQRNWEYACQYGCGWAPTASNKRPDGAKRFHERKCERKPAGGEEEAAA